MLSIGGTQLSKSPTCTRQADRYIEKRTRQGGDVMLSCGPGAGGLQRYIGRREGGGRRGVRSLNPVPSDVAAGRTSVGGSRASRASLAKRSRCSARPVAPHTKRGTRGTAGRRRMRASTRTHGSEHMAYWRRSCRTESAVHPGQLANARGPLRRR